MNVALQKQKYNYADYLSWPEDERIELIDGHPVMHATPSIAHQSVSGELFGQLRDFLKGKPCRVLSAPVTVRLDAKDDQSDDTILEPDIIVVCDSSKLSKQSCDGAPDLVVEILSPSTAKNDKLVKFKKYEKAGVREYWIVDPDLQYAEVNLLRESKYDVTKYSDEDTVPVSVLEGCTIHLPDVFASITEKANGEVIE